MWKRFKIVENKWIYGLQEENRTLKKTINEAKDFIQSIVEGKSEIWIKNNKNENPLINSLFVLQNHLMKLADEEKQRSWSSEGISMFSTILREQNTDLKSLMNKVLAQTIKYIGAVQGGIFLKTEINESITLRLTACYAYNRIKFLEHEIKPGEGILGQVFLENETTYLTEIPENYFKITSGLGESNPEYLILIPLKSNDESFGVLEIASFQAFQPHVIAFLERLSENIASSVSSMKNAEMTKKLLEETQLKTELMSAQEEEMRQNLEELQATQDEMARRQKELDQRNQLVNLIINTLPLPVFVKDENSKYSLVNHAQAQLLGFPESLILGKDDSFFTESASELEEIKKSDKQALESDTPIELPMQVFTTKDGKCNVFKTTKVSFINTSTGQRNIIGISLDLTDRINLEKKILSEKVVQQNNVIIDLAGRQRMLCQKIGFYCELVHKGQKQHIETLQNTLDLHQHSLSVLLEGGIPKGMDVQVPLEKADPMLLPSIDEVQKLWIPFKNAATIVLESAKGEAFNETEKALAFVEENVEKLLTLNNKLLVTYKKISQKALESLNLERTPGDSF
ncbi:MAG: GAF domain-containing protein [Cytophagales bacterium]